MHAQQNSFTDSIVFMDDIVGYIVGFLMLMALVARVMIFVNAHKTQARHDIIHRTSHAGRGPTQTAITAGSR
jgi:hypothetical protein